MEPAWSGYPWRAVATHRDRKPLAPPPLRLPGALREFLRAEAVGGAVLIGAALVAVAWANSPWASAYETLWRTRFALELGPRTLATDLRHWVNEGLMTLFFLVVGLEIKRELVAGELRSWRRAALPVLAAAGGMAVPAAIYAALNAHRAGAAGWGIPMATDVAFALGVLALLGARVPPALRVFLLTLAVVDDIGSILVVAVFYHRGVELGPAAVAAGLVLLVAVLRRVGVWWLPVHVVLGIGLWLALYRAGASPALAGVAMGLLAPGRPTSPPEAARAGGGALARNPRAASLRELLREARGTVPLVERLEHDLHPVTAFLVVPLFALANAGVRVGHGALGGPEAAVLAGIVAGRLLGKLTGIVGAVWLAERLGIAARPSGTTWPQLVGVGIVAGIGFTVPLFVADLAFPAGRFDAAVKLGLLLASVLAAVGGVLVLLGARPPAAPAPPAPPGQPP